MVLPREQRPSVLELDGLTKTFPLLKGSLDETQLIKAAEIGDTVPLWRWIGEGATTFSY